MPKATFRGYRARPQHSGVLPACAHRAPPLSPPLPCPPPRHTPPLVLFFTTMSSLKMTLKSHLQQMWLSPLSLKATKSKTIALGSGKIFLRKKTMHIWDTIRNTYYNANCQKLKRILNGFYVSLLPHNLGPFAQVLFIDSGRVKLNLHDKYY